MPPTGPRTPEGKKISSKNAIRHGLFVEGLVVMRERQEDFDAYRDAVWAERNPVGNEEEELTDKIVSLNWHLARLQRAESEILTFYIWSHRANPKAHTYCNEENELGLGMANAPLDRFDRYRVSFERSLERVKNRLERLQAKRLGEAMNLSDEEKAQMAADAAADAPAEAAAAAVAAVAEAAAAEALCSVRSTREGRAGSDPTCRANCEFA